MYCNGNQLKMGGKTLKEDKRKILLGFSLYKRKQVFCNNVSLAFKTARNLMPRSDGIVFTVQQKRAII